MKKIFLPFLIILLSIILGAAFGFFHNQISYAIAEEYFTKFKFVQFNLAEWGMGHNIGTVDLPEIQLYNPKMSAGMVGIFSTWWVGFFAGIILGVIGMRHNSLKAMWKYTFNAILLTIGVALLTGIIGLLIGKLLLVSNPFNFPLPENIINQRSFIAAASIHNFSYLGGLIGLIFGARYNWKQGR